RPWCALRAQPLTLYCAKGKEDVYGSNAENVQVAANSLPGSTILLGAFRTVDMVLAMPKGRSAAAQDRIKVYLDEAKSSGLVQKAINSANLKGVRLAD